MPHNLAYEFGPYRLDCAKRILTRAGETISLALKATEILTMLVAHAGELVEKDDLLREIWPDSFVEEANLSQNIFTLRKALGDAGRPEIYRNGTTQQTILLARVERCIAETTRNVEHS